MKKKIFMAIAFIAVSSISGQLFAQDAAKTAGYDLKKAVKCRVSSTDEGCSIAFEYDVKSPRDAASGLPTGKRQHKPLIITKEFSVSASDNTVAEVKSPRDAASGQATGKRMHKPISIAKEIDKSSPLLSKSVSSTDAASSGIAIDEPGVYKGLNESMGAGKVSLQDISFTKRCGGKTTKLSCSSEECDVPIDDCPNGECTMIVSWSWGVSNSGSTSTGSAGLGRCVLEVVMQIEDGTCTAMAINEKGLPGDKKPNKSKTNSPK